MSTDWTWQLPVDRVNRAFYSSDDFFSGSSARVIVDATAQHGAVGGGGSFLAYQFVMLCLEAHLIIYSHSCSYHF